MMNKKQKAKHTCTIIIRHNNIYRLDFIYRWLFASLFVYFVVFCVVYTFIYSSSDYCNIFDSVNFSALYFKWRCCSHYIGIDKIVATIRMSALLAAVRKCNDNNTEIYMADIWCTDAIDSNMRLVIWITSA